MECGFESRPEHINIKYKHMTIHDPRISQLENRERSAESSLKNIEQKIANKEKEIQRLEQEKMRHEAELSTLQIEEKRDEASIAVIKSQIAEIERRLEIEERAEKEKSRH